jgi:hypothetical protein
MYLLADGQLSDIFYISKKIIYDRVVVKKLELNIWDRKLSTIVIRGKGIYRAIYFTFELTKRRVADPANTSFFAKIL